MQAFILCGGLGTRLRSKVADRPKSMALIGDKPFLEVLLRRLAVKGITDFVLGTGYLGEQIESYFGNGSQLGLRIAYSRETEPLGTGGALALAAPLLDPEFFMLNGDTYADFDPVEMRRLKDRTLRDEGTTDPKESASSPFIMGLRQVPESARYGAVRLAPDGRLLAFAEKSAGGPGLINAGVYLLDRSLALALPQGKSLSLEKDVLPPFLPQAEAGPAPVSIVRKAVTLWGLVLEGLFIDIGTPADFEAAQTLLA